MISALLFLNLRGEVIISRFYRDNVSRTAVDAFRTRIIAAKKLTSPVVNIDKTSFLYTRYGDVFVVGITRQNANPTLIFQFIFKLIDLFRAYFGGAFDEDNIRNNFVLVYELLDEIADYGYPQLTAVAIIKDLIKHGSVKAGREDEVGGKDPNVITSEVTGSVDWRQPNKYFYKKNEVYIDVLESVNLLMSTKGTVLRADVSGRIIMKTFLTGMPECKFGLNDQLTMEKEVKQTHARSAVVRRAGSGIAIEDVTFHRCVKLSQFENDRTISFVPPDGEFELMRYRVAHNINLPFKVIPIITEHGRTRVEYEIKIKGNFSHMLFAQNVIIKIPTPENVSKTSFHPSVGKVKYVPSQQALLWKISKFPGNAAYTLKAEATMIATLKDKPWGKPPITMEFQVPMFTASGLHVRFLRVVERSAYDTVKWVRYMTRAGQVEFRWA